MPSSFSTASAQSASSSTGRHSGAGTPRANEIVFCGFASGSGSGAGASSPSSGASGSGAVVSSMRRSVVAVPAAQAAARTCSATSCATSVGVVPTAIPAASSASFLACAVPDEPEMIAPAWPIVLPGGAEKPAM